MRSFATTGAFALAVFLAVPAFATPTDDVKNALIALGQATSYHLVIVSNGKTGEGDWVAPDKMQFTFGSTEIIRIGTTSWVHVQGHWMQVPAAAAGSMGAGATSGVSEAQSMAANAKNVTVADLGMKTVAGATMHAYSVVQSGDTSPRIIYVGSDGRVQRIEHPTSTGTSSVTFSKFNQPATISPPQM
jgi:hypothetical protein